ncbi:MAG: hypothetical protein ISP61_03815 [Flavobacteriaceae bacterium]|nr:hypothetical protein [Flavobacteriaceae bacterium]
MILPVSYSIDLNFDKNAVWSVLREKEHLNLFHPFCKKNNAQLWNDKSKKDSLEYLNGVILYRDFFEWNEGVGFKLNIGTKNGKKSKVIWELKGDKTSNLRITVYPHIYGDKNIIIYLFGYLIFIRPGLRKYLKSVLLGLEWYLKNQKPVPKNQFGSHKRFSLVD